jgi:hypothetical protein
MEPVKESRLSTEREARIRAHGGIARERSGSPGVFLQQLEIMILAQFS